MAKRRVKRASQRRVSARLRKTVRRASPKRKVARAVRRSAPKRKAVRQRASRIRLKQKAPSRRMMSAAKRIERQAPLPKPALKISEQEIGFISQYFTTINVGIIELTKGNLSRGDKIRIKGETTDFTQVIDSMQYEHQPIENAEAGKSIGIKVSDRVREHDKVYKVE